MEKPSPEPLAKLSTYGGFWRRAIASSIDGIILTIILWVVTALLRWMRLISDAQDPSEFSAWRSLLGLLAATIDFFVFFSYYEHNYRTQGATPGKAALGLQVRDAKSGEMLTLRQVFMREVVGRLLILLSFGVGIVMVALRKDKRGIHDLVAGSIVYRSSEENQGQLAQ